MSSSQGHAESTPGVVHILMVIAAGPINELRSMITGWYRSEPETTGEKA